ncbi:MAG TPA: hypothetical protein VFG20_15145 [Planctomycetaceae bacterium]|nr:hypothetical protein [Planctomycetaceae bacterium]
MSRTTQYSEEFLRRTVLRVMSECTEQRVELSDDDCLHAEFFERHKWDLEDIDFFGDLGRELGTEIDWRMLLKSPLEQLTGTDLFELFRAIKFKDLLLFLQEHCKPPSFAPLDLPGVPGCDEAGVFLGVAELVRRIDHRQSRIAPSMPVGKVLRGSRLMQLWHRLSILSESAVPIPSAPRLIWGLYCYLFAAVTLMVGILGEIFQPGWGWLFSVGLLWGFKFFHIGRWLRESAVPLPPGVETWGDLARYLAPRWPGTHEIAR